MQSTYTQDDVGASLAKDESVSVFASRGVSTKQYYDDIHSVIGFDPNITVDDGADLIVEMHKNINKSKSIVYGGLKKLQQELLGYEQCKSRPN